MSSENKYFAKESEYAIKSIEKINYNDLSEEKIQEIITETNKSRKKFFDELNEKTDENGSAETTDSKTNYKKSTSIAKRFKEMLLISGIAKTEGSAKSILSEMKNGKKPFEEDKARIYCFAAGLNTVQTNNTLRKTFGYYGLYMGSYVDVIYSFFFRNNSEKSCIDKFKEATELINEYKEKYESEKNKDAEHSTERKSTTYFEERVESAETIEDLKKILDIVIKNSGIKHRTATKNYCDLVNGAIKKSFQEMAKTYDSNFESSSEFAKFTIDYAKLPYETKDFLDDSLKLYWESLRRLTDYFTPYNSFLINKKKDKKDEYSFLISCWKDNYNYSIERFEKHRIIKESGKIKKELPVKDSSEFIELAEWISDNFKKKYDEVVNDLRKIFIKNTFTTNFAINKYDYKYFIEKWKKNSWVLQSNSKVRKHSEATESKRIGNFDFWFPKEGYQTKNCVECNHYEACGSCNGSSDNRECKLCMHKVYCDRKNRKNYVVYSTEDEKIISEGNELAERRRCNQCKHHRKEKCLKCDICNRFNNKVYSADRDCIDSATRILSLDYLNASQIKNDISYCNLMNNYLTFKPTINNSYDLIFLLLSIFYETTEKIGLVTDIESDMPDYLISSQSYLNRLEVYIDALKKESIDIKDCAKSRTILVFMKLINEVSISSTPDFKTVQYSYIINAINKLLEECNMALLDPYNPFDLLIILALKTKAPFYVLYTALDLLNEQEN